jgi:hypothetical protein
VSRDSLCVVEIFRRPKNTRGNVDVLNRESPQTSNFLLYFRGS